MMKSQMEWKSNTESAIATVMGLDQLRHRQQLGENRRLLSDGYIHKADSIGVRKGSLVSVGRPCGMKNGNVEVKDALGIDPLECKDGVDLGKYDSSMTSKGVRFMEAPNALLSKSLSGCRDKRSVGKKDEDCCQGKFMRYVQKREHDLVLGCQNKLIIDYMNKTSKFGLEMVVKASIMERELGNVAYGFNDGKSSLHSKSGYSLNQQPALIPEKVRTNDIRLHRHTCIGCAQNMKRVSEKLPTSRKFAEASMLGYMGDDYFVNCQDIENGHTSYLSPNQMSPKMQHFERWMRTKVVRRIEFSEMSKSPKMLAKAEKVGKVMDSLSSGQKLRQHDSTPEYISGGSNGNQFKTSLVLNDARSHCSNISDQHIEDERSIASENDKSGEVETTRRISESSIGNLAAGCEIDVSHASGEACGAEVCCGANDEPQFKRSHCIASGEGGHPSYANGDFSSEMLLNELSEELTCSNRSRVSTPEFLKNPSTTNQQHSPDTVLKPFYGQYDSADHFDSIGLQLQLQVLNLETEDSYSEGSLMGISGEDDSDEQLADLTHGGRKVKRWLGGEESRNFSYMVDVLDEARFFGVKSCVDFNTWHSLECTVSPSVFETLEKKYGKQTSWPKPDRKLLFNSINFGLMAVFNSVMSFHPSLKSTFRANMRRDEVEDQLWTLLVRAERYKNTDLSGKALEEWFEAEEGMNIICNELASSLFDELVEELVCQIDG